jgi:hypothetical protein
LTGAARRNNAGMSTPIFHRWRLAIRSLSSTNAGSHRLSCPPAIEVLGLRPWLLRTLREAVGARPDGAHRRGAGKPSASVLAITQCEFDDALAGLPGWQSAAMRERIRRADSMRELWHLRVDVFSLVALHLNQAEAEDRLAWLNRRFPIRGPRSGFAELTAREVA